MNKDINENNFIENNDVIPDNINEEKKRNIMKKNIKIKITLIVMILIQEFIDNIIFLY